MFRWLKNSSGETIRTAVSFFLVSSLALMILQSCTVVAPESGLSGPVKVELVERNGRHMLLRGGKPYFVNGAGLVDKMEDLAAHGANSFRTWSLTSSGSNTQEMLDKAHQLGLTVSLGVYVGSERHGFDYSDEARVNKQLQRIKKAVQEYKNHPALLAWIVGNELNHDMTDPAVYDAVNDISLAIKALDPNHPTTTTVAGFNREMGEIVSQRAPSIDFLSIQLYGDLINLPQYIKDADYRKPYMVSEWGAVGHWEVVKTEWGAPIEYNSTMKAANYLKSYQQVIQPYRDQIIGSYVFLWGQKQERTPTWYGMFTDIGERTEAVDTMHFIWNGRWPTNRAPRAVSLSLAGKTAEENVVLKSNGEYQALLDVSDSDEDELAFRWTVMRESEATQTGGDREEIPDELTGLIKEAAGNQVTIRAPDRQGAYRLFVYASDGYNNAAHANIPFYVTP